LQNNHDVIQQLEGKLKSLQNTAKQRAALMKYLRKDNQWLKDYLTKVQMLEAEAARLWMAAVECTATTKKLQQDISLLESQKLELDAEVERVERVLMTLQKDSVMSDKHLWKIGKEMVAVRALNLRLKEEACRGVAQCSRLDVEVKKVECGAPVLRLENQRLEQELLWMQRQMAEAMDESQEKLKWMNGDLQAKNLNLQQWCGRLERWVTPQGDRAADSKELTDANQKLRTQLIALEESSWTAQEENERLHVELTQERGVVDEIRNRVAGIVEEGILAFSNCLEPLLTSEAIIHVKFKADATEEANTKGSEYLLKSKEKEKPRAVKEESG